MEVLLRTHWNKARKGFVFIKERDKTKGRPLPSRPFTLQRTTCDASVSGGGSGISPATTTAGNALLQVLALVALLDDALPDTDSPSVLL